MTRSDRSASSRSRRGHKEAKILIKIPSEIRYIKEVWLKILADIKPYNVDPDTLFDIRLCVEEALNNAVMHGNNSDNRLFVNVSYWVEGADFNIEIKDEGGGFDHKLIPDPTTDDNIMKGSGRGVYLIENLMDRVEFNKAGNTIKMVKHLK